MYIVIAKELEIMRKSIKKSISLFLAAVMLIVGLPVVGLTFESRAADNNSFSEGYYTYEVENGKATITGCDKSISGDVTIPKKLGGYPVTSIGICAFMGCRELVCITIPKGVKTIETGAFERCTGLKSIKIPDSVTSIGDHAFSGCTGLKSITVSDSVTNIGPEVFWECTSLTNITIPNSVKSISEGAFYGCTGLKSIKIPNSVTSIGGSAFYGTAWYNSQPDGNVYAGKVYYKYKGTMPRNTSITIKDGTKGIAGYAFHNCTGLKSITIPNSVKNIGNFAFEHCNGLTSITIPNSVTNIGYNAFSGCSGLKSITVSDSVTNIGPEVFWECTSLTNITIPNSVKSISEGAFYGCTGLKSIKIPNSVTSIGGSAFYGTAWYNSQPDGNVYAGKVYYKYKGTMPNNTSVKIKNGTKGIAGDAFYGCTGLKSIKIPDSMTSIGNWAFIGCTGLKSIIIPDSVTSIGNEAFRGCTELTKIQIGIGVKSIGEEAFGGIKTIPQIYYAGSKSDWNKISISLPNDMLLYAKMHYNAAIGHNHNYVKSTQKATTSKNGKTVTACTACGKVKKTTVIYKASSVKLSKTSYTYNGKAQKPKVVVKTSKGKALTEGKDYTVKYQSGRKNPGKYTVTVTFKGNYSGKKTLTFTIAPKAPTLKATAAKKSAKLSWNKQTGATGYNVYMSTSKNGKYQKIATVKNGKVSYTKTGLTKGKTYYFKVTAYTTSGGKTVNSVYSSVKSVKAK